MSSWITWDYIDNEVLEVLKTSGSVKKKLALDDTRARIESYDAKSLVAPQGLGS
jgi:hypothetical protein